MEIILNASKFHCHSRLSEPILKILSIYRKNILGKQLSLAIFPKYFFRLLHAPKFQILSTKLNMTVIAVYKCSMKKLLWWILLECTYTGVSFLINFHTYRIKKDACTSVSWEFYQIFQNAFLQNSSEWLLLLNTFFCSLRRLQPKNASFDLGYFKYFWDKHCELLVSNCLWSS